MEGFDTDDDERDFVAGLDVIELSPIISNMNKIIELKEKTLAQIKSDLAFGLNITYLVVYKSELFIGKVVKHTVGTMECIDSYNFVCNGSIFPAGIPFESLDNVWEMVELMPT